MFSGCVKEDGRRLNVLCAQGLDDVQTVPAGKHAVDHQNVEGALAGQGQSGIEILGAGGVMATLAQALLNDGKSLGIVLDNQNPHRPYRVLEGILILTTRAKAVQLASRSPGPSDGAEAVVHVYLPIAGVSVEVFSLVLLGTAVGVLSGVFGVGGGFLLTPFLIFMGIPAPVAVASGANQVVGASVSGLIAHLRRRNVDFRMGGVLVASGFVGSVAGVWAPRGMMFWFPLSSDVMRQGVGFAGQALFFSRMFVRWIQSERRGQSVVSPVFWYLSAARCALLLSYAIHKNDPVFILGQAPGLFVYGRNIYFIRRHRTVTSLVTHQNRDDRTL